MTKILCLDLAGQTGFAIWSPAMDQPLYGAVRLPKASLGQTFASFRDFLSGKIVGERIEHVAIESPYIDKVSLNAVEKLYGLKAHAEEICYRRGVPCRPVSSAEWRKHFIGQPRAPQTLAKAQRRKWLKDQVRLECQRRGWAVTSDDEADALGVLVYERARILPRWGCDTELFGYEQIAPPMGMERVP